MHHRLNVAKSSALFRKSDSSARVDGKTRAFVKTRSMHHKDACILKSMLWDLCTVFFQTSSMGALPIKRKASYKRILSKRLRGANARKNWISTSTVKHVLFRKISGFRRFYGFESKSPGLIMKVLSNRAFSRES